MFVRYEQPRRKQIAEVCSVDGLCSTQMPIQVLSTSDVIAVAGEDKIHYNQQGHLVNRSGYVFIYASDNDLVNMNGTRVVWAAKLLTIIRPKELVDVVLSYIFLARI